MVLLVAEKGMVPAASVYLQRNRIRVVQIEAVGYQIESINCGKASLLQRFLEH